MLTILLALLALLFAPAPAAEPKQTQATPAPAAADDGWHLTLPAAIQANLNQSEGVRCVMIGCQPIPVGGFEPNPVSPLADAYDRSAGAP